MTESPVPATDRPPYRHHDIHVLEIVGLRSTVLRALRLFVEAMIVPTLLLAILVHVVGLVASVGAAVGWVVLAVGFRWLFTRSVPGTLWLSVCVLSGRALAAVATSSLFIYVLQPVVGSLLMATMFVGTAMFGRPLTLKLARDFLVLPDEFVNRKGIRRMFKQIALLWGVSRAIDASVTWAFLHTSVSAALLSRGLLSPVLSGLTILASTMWGMRCLRRSGVRLRLVPSAQG